ncbi:MAG: transcription-repair coupling factor [Desulfobacterales bacterium]|nr:MAG: transcription-repair coupling factor [Desulfobacterales bacterium]
MFMTQNQGKISIESLTNIIHETRFNVDCTGLSGSDRAYLAYRLYLAAGAPVVVIVPSTLEAETFLEDIRFFSGKLNPPILYFPPYNILPFKYLSYHNATAAMRIATLYQIIDATTPPIVVTSINALIQNIIPKQEISDFAELILTHEELDAELLTRKLISGGYTRTMVAEEPGDFCIRGGIIDVFTPLYSNPIRIELFGDTVESIRFFSAVNQRTIEKTKEAIILPAREIILKMERMDQIITRVRAQASKLEIPVTKVRELIHRIKNEGVFPGIESLIPLIYTNLSTLFDYIPNHALFILSDPGELEKAAEQSLLQASNSFNTACNEARLCVEPDSLYQRWSNIQDTLTNKKLVTIRHLPLSTLNAGDGQTSRKIHFSVKDNNAIRLELKRRREKNLFSPVANWINEQLRLNNTTLILCRTLTKANRLQSLLEPYGIHLTMTDSIPDTLQSQEQALVILGQVSSGFVWPTESLAIITEDDIFGRKYQHRKKPDEKVRTELLTFEDLKKGDLVVHVEQGIGQYQGLVKLTVNGSSNDFLLIVYKDDDKLYLPVDRMNMIQKYMGVDEIKPSLDKMGGKSWARVKARVKKSTEKIAGELLKLYAERKVKKGYTFEDVDSDFQDFEAGFPYEETNDQIKAIEDTLTDMKTQIPMDRLICGDVGYGKTEVALRASLLAVNAGKQVAVLVPTTVLAEQHFETFSGRFEHYPINLACLSRFRSLRKQREIVNNLKAGKIDIVIGTHRLIQKDVEFKDLGLLVLDEEQRFGVRHKEKLKNMRSTVDVLALTATPIPRTLHMSLMGIRDISVISTPPEHRKSIITYISEFDDAIILDAIQRELNRNGQIFFVHNDIRSIESMAQHVQHLVPQVRLDVAHGRLDEETLETVMLRFINKEIDMLVCTTIIESGLDIPSANTILINRADRFGLAQIYQLRGRVGRFDEQAYAYLFIPSESSLGKDAQKRLKVLMEHSDLGSGFQIAMSDLQIRGGGTILGASQSGHIAAVGYDMFLKLMEESMAEMKGEPIKETLEPEINITLSAFIPESYIPDIDQRLSTYRHLTKMTGLNEIANLKEELIDRFGIMPVEAQNLLLKIMLRVLAINAGVKRLDLSGEWLSLAFSEAHQKNSFGILDLVVSESKRFEFTPNHILKAKLSENTTIGRLTEAKNVLKEIKQRVN